MQGARSAAFVGFMARSTRSVTNPGNCTWQRAVRLHIHRSILAPTPLRPWKSRLTFQPVDDAAEACLGGKLA